MPHRIAWKHLKEFLVHRVLHVDDTPHRIALGVAMAIFVTWTPTVGFQMALAVGLAWLLGANKLVGVPFVWISNPLTLVPLFLPNYYVGRWILGSDAPAPDFAAVANVSGGWLAMLERWWSVTWQAILPLWVGSLIVASVLAVPSYFAMYQAVVIYRRKKRDYRARRIDREHDRVQERTTSTAADDAAPTTGGGDPD